MNHNNDLIILDHMTKHSKEPENNLEPVRQSKEDKHWYCPYDSCEYKSLNKSHAKCHVGTHTRVKPVDTRERPFKCDQCDYSATRTDTLTKHKRRIHGVEPKLIGKKTRQKREHGMDSSDPELDFYIRT